MSWAHAAAFIVGLAVGFIGYVWIDTPERRRRCSDLASARFDTEFWRDQARHYQRLYGGKVAEVTVYLSRFGGDNPLSLGTEVSREAQDIDQEWANLCAQADVERIWREGGDDDA